MPSPSPANDAATHETSARRSRPMRRDGVAHRAALIEAAAMCFEEQGYLVPLETIAERAGVGRGTLYRNFDDRMTLALAVFEQKADEASADLDPALSLDQALAELMRRRARPAALFNRLAAEMSMTPDNEAALRRISARSAERIGPVVARAKAAGILPVEFDPERISIASRMISGLILPHMTEEAIDDQIAAALPIIMDGLRTR